MKVTKTIYLHLSNMQYRSSDYAAFDFEFKSDPDYTLICSKEVEFNIPDSFNPVAIRVAALDKKLDLIHAEYQQRIRFVEDEKAKLLCLENGMPA